MTITICGSQTFCKEMETLQQQLRDIGMTAHAPEELVTEEWYQEQHSREELLRMKPIWTKNHFKKIKQSDAVIICNYEKKGIKGYFGSNTLIELAVAFYLNKPIYLLFPYDESHPHYDELAGLGVIVLDGDLEKLQPISTKTF